ncbi:hypothetical protein LOAG_19201 [Loa loa]|uniref:Uncharacterized protein n=1 Tax=Loa loa TaxID=7209 RepID=A0A1S0UCT8_LOALO|nr:hypothetical protein LOAG_19201 [Loa loa]EJD73375.1 hypothetical protein LOAG_19201 [Loa loa]
MHGGETVERRAIVVLHGHGDRFLQFQSASFSTEWMRVVESGGKRRQQETTDRH